MSGLNCLWLLDIQVSQVQKSNIKLDCTDLKHQDVLLCEEYILKIYL